MSVLKVKYVDDTNDAPFLSYPKAMIVLTNNNELYAAPRYDSSTQGINLLWSLDNRLKGNVINNILREIKPLVSEILILENYDEHARFVIYYDVRSIIDKFENDRRNNIVRQIHYYDYVDGTELPPAFRDSIDSGDFVDEYGIVFYESSDEIYDKLTEELVENIYDNSDSYNSASNIIKSVYSDYKKDGYSDEFWNDLIPKLIDIDYYDIYSVSGRNLYYNDQLIKL